ncbi:MAG: hypothetical protein ACXVGH_08915, partial [Mycobacteriales bacterium]
VETYSSSKHLFSDLDIPEGVKGHLPRAAQTRAGLDAEVLEDVGETGRKPKKAPARGGSRDGARDGARDSRPSAGEDDAPALPKRSGAPRQRTRGAGAAAASSAGTPAGPDAGTTDGPADGDAPKRPRRRRGGRGRGGSGEGSAATEGADA